MYNCGYTVCLEEFGRVESRLQSNTTLYSVIGRMLPLTIFISSFILFLVLYFLLNKDFSFPCFRLVGGLASEKVRWAESVQHFKEEEKTLAGDVLLTASYLSYVGCFGRSYRVDMLENMWLQFLGTLEVCPFTIHSKHGRI